jgi:hypothetical protein
MAAWDANAVTCAFRAKAPEWVVRMYSRIKPTKTVYPCQQRSRQSDAITDTTTPVWMTWEAVEREHFNPTGSVVADFSRGMEVDADLIRNHRYEPERA